jgi:hypothetical protein
MKDQFYDVVIDAKTFEDLNDSGWNVQMSKTAQRLLNEEDRERLIKELQKDVDKAKTKKEKAESEKQLQETEEKINKYTKYNQWAAQEKSVIGVIEERNRGKTFLLSKMSDYYFPTGHNTKGISAKYLDDGYIFLDTAGNSTQLFEIQIFHLIRN